MIDRPLTDKQKRTLRFALRKYPAPIEIHGRGGKGSAQGIVQRGLATMGIKTGGTNQWFYLHHTLTLTEAGYAVAQKLAAEDVAKATGFEEQDD